MSNIGVSTFLPIYTSPSGSSGTNASGQTGALNTPVPPTVVAGLVSPNSNTNIVSMFLWDLNASGVYEISSSPSGLTAPSVTNTTAFPYATGVTGTKCFLFLDASQTGIINNITGGFTGITGGSDYTASPTQGYYEPTTYTGADALFRAVALGTIASPTGGVVDCHNLFNYTGGNWGGASGSFVTVTGSTGPYILPQSPDMAKYNWFAIFANRKNANLVDTDQNAYTVLVIPGVSGQ